MLSQSIPLSQTPRTLAPWKVAAAAVAGNTIEFYDFVVYSFFAVHIGRHFFPIESEFGNLLAAVITFGLGFVARPLGGLIVGAYADIRGRRAALMLTVVLMTVGTLGIAICPGHAEIGLAAPVLLVVCRLMQGFALGGEVGPATALLIEASPVRRRGLYASWQLASQGMAIGLGGAVGVTVTALLTPAQLGAWGWRIPFMVGLALIPVAIIIRRQLPEGWHATTRKAGYLATLAGGLRRHRRLLAWGLLAMMGAVVSTQVVQFMATYAIRQQLVPAALGQASVLVAGIATVVGALVAGVLCDRWGRKRIMWVPCALLALLAVPLFWGLNAVPGAATMFLAAAVVAGLTAAYGTACLITVPELLPRESRATGVSIVYGCGLALFGATSQFVFAWLGEALQDPLAPAYYVTLAALLSLMAIRHLPESRPRVQS
ncbi:MFS transporter [Acidovorax sp. sic0104]|uniref:MFS transporter n=1 Tax=Acidovorax sp. sic0104 TaxID=2854784 RepID=UPI001C4833B4|nr:MFS transporter [Acidovorax sp. sic0104]MBV7539800.1 MFS transporter [Acidovorax sp. sic0104]